MPSQSALLLTAEEYSQQSTVHGIAYAFDKSLSRSDRFLWLICCVAFAILAGYFTFHSYNNWQENLVVISLKNLAKPVDEINFPAVTICSPGLYMHLTEAALMEDFVKWKGNASFKDLSEELAQFMADVFQIDDKSTNILDILDTMVASDVESSIASNSVRENIVACSGGLTEETNRRRKRDVANGILFMGIILIGTLSCSS